MTVDDGIGPGIGLVTLGCPECGTQVTTRTGQRLASDFCPTCDYPMFWARRSEAATPAADGDSTRRSPGVQGTRQGARIACPACEEPNLPEALVCLRCGASMIVPVVPPPVVPPPEPAVVVVEEIVRCDHPPVWQIVLWTGLATMALTLLLVLLVWAVLR